jgi:hypothetical protein
MERPMTRQSILFSVLAICLAVISVSMAPKPLPPAAPQSTASNMMPIHALTGVAFHAVSGAY